MNEWELTDEELNTAVTSGAAQYKHERDTAIAWGDEEYYEHCAIATAAQKKLVEWWLDNFNVSALTPELAEKWKAFLAALGVK